MNDLLEHCSLPSIQKIKLLSSTLAGQTFLLQAKEQNYILQHLSDDYDEEKVAEWAISYRYFSERGCPFPDLLFFGKLDQTRAFLTNYSCGKTKVSWSEEEIKEIGFFLATFHQLSARSPYAISSLSFPQKLKKDFHAIKGTIPKEFDILEKEIDRIEGNWPTSLPTGIIHGDIWPQNIRFINNKISAVLNFINPSSDPFLIDLAQVLQKREELRLPLLAAYEQIRPLKREELESLDFIIASVALNNIVRLLKQGSLSPINREANYTNALSHFYKWRASLL